MSTDLTIAYAASGIANVVMVGLLAGAIHIIRRQGQRILRLGGAVADLTAEEQALRSELTIAEAEVHRLMAASDRDARVLEGLRDENRRLLRSMVTGEAS